MSRPIVVTFPHRSTKSEVKTRLQRGLGQIRSELAPFASAIEERWAGDRMEFGLSAIGQRVTGSIALDEELVRIEVYLPALLAFLGATIATRIRRQGIILLKAPDEPDKDPR